MVKEHTIFFVKYFGLCYRKLYDILAVKACEILKKHETQIGTTEERLYKRILEIKTFLV